MMKLAYCRNSTPR